MLLIESAGGDCAETDGGLSNNIVKAPAAIAQTKYLEYLNRPSRMIPPDRRVIT